MKQILGMKKNKHDTIGIIPRCKEDRIILANKLMNWNQSCDHKIFIYYLTIIG
jgi:hypothetical protein